MGLQAGASALSVGMLYPTSFSVLKLENGFLISEHNTHPQKQYIATTIEEVKARVEELLTLKEE